MGWEPQIVPRPRTPCHAWRLRDGRGNHPIGAQCSDCGQDVALDRGLTGFDPVCVYCALETGLLPMEEISPEDERSLHEIAMAGRPTTTRKED